MNTGQKEFLEKVLNKESVFRKNPEKENSEAVLKNISEKNGLGFSEIEDAEKRLQRFSSFLKKAFPDTGDGIIESELKSAFEFGNKVLGLKDNFYIKCDNSLPVAGSIKARGGIYEILKFAESLAFENNMITEFSDYSVFASEEMHKLLSGYHVAVGSTGNLGMSIGIISAKLGFRVTIHMSKEAKDWKKNKLRALGVNVIEHKGAYAEAVEQGRTACKKDPFSYFVDDENSKELFLGYSVSALRLKKQLKEKGIAVDKKNPLFVYLPCGVGGAPGGISFGLKHVFGDNVKCYFAEPVNAPSVMLGLIEKRKINFKEYSFKMETDADGLAVDSPSELVLDVCGKLIDGTYTVSDEVMYRDLFMLGMLEKEKIEVSAAASLHGALICGNTGSKGTHLAWLTGGLFVPEYEYKMMFEIGREYQ